MPDAAKPGAVGHRGEEMEINKFTTQFVPHANNTGPDYREKNRMFKTWFDL